MDNSCEEWRRPAPDGPNRPRGHSRRQRHLPVKSEPVRLTWHLCVCVGELC